jgi:hypothetical protein
LSPAGWTETVFSEEKIRMGILTVQQGAKFVISSDRRMTDAPVKRLRSRKPSVEYQVWTGNSWSSVKTDAMTFGTMDEADEYVKANYRRLSGA